MIRKTLSLWCLIIAVSFNVIIQGVGSSRQVTSGSTPAQTSSRSSTSSDAASFVQNASASSSSSSSTDAPNSEEGARPAPSSAAEQAQLDAVRKQLAIKRIIPLIEYDMLCKNPKNLCVDLRSKAVRKADNEVRLTFNRKKMEITIQGNLGNVPAQEQNNKIMELTEKCLIEKHLPRQITQFAEFWPKDIPRQYELSSRRLGLLTEFCMLQRTDLIEDSLIGQAIHNIIIELKEKAAEIEKMLGAPEQKISNPAQVIEMAEESIFKDMLLELNEGLRLYEGSNYSSCSSSVPSLNGEQGDRFWHDVDLKKYSDKFANLVVDSMPEELRKAYNEILFKFKDLGRGMDIHVRDRFKKFILGGDPGTGKSIVGEVIARNAGAKCRVIACDKLTDKFQKSASVHLDLIAPFLLNTNEKWVIVIDEIDKIDTKHQLLEGDSTGDGLATFNRLLTELIGRDNVVVIATTNYFDSLPIATKSRFGDQCIDYPLPNDTQRQDIITNCLEESLALHEIQADALEADNIKKLVKYTDGWSIRRITDEIVRVIAQDLATRGIERREEIDEMTTEADREAALARPVRTPAAALVADVYRNGRQSLGRTCSWVWEKSSKNQGTSAAIVGAVGLVTTSTITVAAYYGKPFLEPRIIDLARRFNSFFPDYRSPEEIFKDVEEDLKYFENLLMNGEMASFVNTHKDDTTGLESSAGESETENLELSEQEEGKEGKDIIDKEGENEENTDAEQAAKHKESQTGGSVNAEYSTKATMEVSAPFLGSAGVETGMQYGANIKHMRTSGTTDSTTTTTTQSTDKSHEEMLRKEEIKRLTLALGRGKTKQISHKQNFSNSSGRSVQEVYIDPQNAQLCLDRLGLDNEDVTPDNAAILAKYALKVIKSNIAQARRMYKEKGKIPKNDFFDPTVIQKDIDKAIERGFLK